MAKRPADVDRPQVTVVGIAGGTHPSRDSKVDVEPMLTEPPPTEVGSYFLSTEAMNFEAALNKSRQSKASRFRRDKYS
jgi:hypothetical protein